MHTATVDDCAFLRLATMRRRLHAAWLHAHWASTTCARDDCTFLRRPRVVAGYEAPLASTGRLMWPAGALLQQRIRVAASLLLMCHCSVGTSMGLDAMDCNLTTRSIQRPT